MTLSPLQFIREVFRDLPAGAAPVVAGFRGDPRTDADWRPHAVNGHLPEVVEPDSNAYYAIASIRPDEHGEFRRRKEYAAAVHVIVVDDVGVNGKILPDDITLPPSFEIETSPDNSQYGYLLVSPVSKDEALPVINALSKGAAGDAGGQNAARWVRLPAGVNGKASVVELYGEPFPVTLHQWHPERRYTLRQIVEGLKLDARMPRDEKPRVETVLPTLRALRDAGRILREELSRPGTWHIVCPWSHEHTGGDVTGTYYYEPHTNRSEHEGFRCNHGHCAERTIRDLRRALDVAKDEPAAGIVKPRAELAISAAELQAASLAPRCLVENYLYADVGVVCAPGGVGKTTMLLHEGICIALGRPVWGMPVHATGWVLFVTNEDPRERLAARLREIMRAMGLTEEEQRRVREAFIPLDVTGTGTKLTFLDDGNIVWTSLAKDLADCYRDDPPDLIIFDPLVSFGASEGLVNDNEQALVNVARHLVRELGCCVRYVHHVGKVNARAQTTDQYSGRGGSALPDGCRMVAVLAAWNESDTLPAGCKAAPGVGIFKLERPKLSYARPNLPTVWIRREGFAYEHFIEYPQSPDEAAAARVEQLERYISHCVKGRPPEYHTRKTLEESATKIGMTRNALRAALATLEAQARVVTVPLPPMHRHGGRQTFLCTSDLAAQFGEVAP